MKNEIKKIVTIGGGSGQYVLLSGLRDLENIGITTVVSMVDSGGSTGVLRDEFGVLPPGDIFKCILALSPDRENARKILQTRFTCQGRLNGHNAGNMLLSFLSQYTGSFSEGVNALAQILNIKGTVLPVTVDRATLVAELTDGSHLYGEAAIDIPRGDQRQKIKSTFLVPHHSESIKVYPPVIEAIKKADYIIIGPGDLYTSITPNFLVPGVKEALADSSGEIIFIVNIMTKFGETDNFTVSNFIKEIKKSIGKEINHVIINKERPDRSILEDYKKQKANFVEVDKKLPKRNIIKEDLLDMAGGIVRHNSGKLAEVIKKLIK